MMNTLVLVRGLPGSGKSTIAKSFVTHPSVENIKMLTNDFGDTWYQVKPTVHLEADMFYTDHEGKYTFSADLLPHAHKWCSNTARIFMNAGYNVIVSNTFTTLKEMKPYLEHAELIGMPIRVIRMENNFGSIHNVPEETIQRMRDRFQDYPGEQIIKYDSEPY